MDEPAYLDQQLGDFVVSVGAGVVQRHQVSESWQEGDTKQLIIHTSITVETNHSSSPI